MAVLPGQCVTGSGFITAHYYLLSSSVQVTISHFLTQSQRLYCHRRYCSVRHPHCSHISYPECYCQSWRSGVNGIDYTNFALPFTYEANVTVISLTPSIGELTGGSLTVVTGRQFVNTSQLACIFDNDTTSSLFVVPATIISDTSISCITPSHSDDTVLVRVTLNGEDYSQNGLTYTYVPVWTLSSITPTYGFASGHTQLTVTGTNFLNTSTLSCIFDNGTSNGASPINVQATYVDATTLLCATPSHAVVGLITRSQC